MASPDASLSKLESIRTKIRRLTRSPSSAQITNAQIDDYINTFVLYDFPEYIQNTTLTFYTSANVDTYKTNTVNEDNPLYNFKNIYNEIYSPIYVNGTKSYLTLSRNEFYDMYPQTRFAEIIATGNAVLTNFTGTLNHSPVLQGSVSIDAIYDSTSDQMNFHDIPTENATSGLIGRTGNLYLLNNDTTSYGTINYVTGVYDITFPNAPDTATNINAQYYSYQAGKPTTIFFDNKQFVLRPVPDKVYKIDLSVLKRPTALLTATQTPDLSQWWQYIAYGAAKKIFEDRMDMDSVQAIFPEFEKQRLNVIERKILKNSAKRAATIYRSGGNLL